MESVQNPQQKRQASARAMGRAGYALSESAAVVGLYFVHKPGAAHPYAVDVTDAQPTCNCPDYTGKNACGTCKHVEFVRIAVRFVATLARKAAAAAQPVRTPRRSLFTRKHLAALRAIAPILAPVQPASVVTITTTGRRILSPEEMRRRMDADFGPALNS